MPERQNTMDVSFARKKIEYAILIWGKNNPGVCLMMVYDTSVFKPLGFTFERGIWMLTIESKYTDMTKHTTQ